MKKNILSLFFGFFAGLVSGFFGAGGGLLLIPFFSLYLKEDEVKSRATTIFCIFFLALVSSFFYLKNSSIDWVVGIKSGIGGIICGFIGSKLLNKISSIWLNILFVIFLIYSGLKFVF